MAPFLHTTRLSVRPVGRIPPVPRILEQLEHGLPENPATYDYGLPADELWATLGNSGAFF